MDVIGKGAVFLPGACALLAAGCAQRVSPVDPMDVAVVSDVGDGDVAARNSFDDGAMGAPDAADITERAAVVDAAVDARVDPGLLPPRPIAPLSTATVTTRRPTLRWQLAAGTDGAQVDICRDRACTMVFESFDAAGSSGKPATELPPGVMFWRTRGRAGAAAVGQRVSPTWEFSVGALSAPTDTSWGSAPDVNGDGFADVLVGEPSFYEHPGDAPYGRAYVFAGGSGGVDRRPSAVLTSPEREGGFGGSVASAGDVDGDGYADVVIGSSGANRAYVYLGGSSGLAVAPARTLDGPTLASAFGASVAGAGDVNGDGYADVLIGASGDASSPGHVFVYFGGAGGVSATPSVSFEGAAAGDGFGTSVASAGDVNADGYLVRRRRF